jgi:hypothetical protein
MLENIIDAMAEKVGGMAIQSSAGGLYYIVTKSDKKRVAIVSTGTCVLTLKQARMLAKELPDVLNEYCGG